MVDRDRDDKQRDSNKPLYEDDRYGGSDDRKIQRGVSESKPAPDPKPPKK